MITGAAEFFESATPLKRLLIGLFCVAMMPTYFSVLRRGLDPVISRLELRTGSLAHLERQQRNPSDGGNREARKSSASLRGEALLTRGFVMSVLTSVFLIFIFVGSIYTLIMLAWCVSGARRVEAVLLWSARSVVLLVCTFVAIGTLAAVWQTMR